MQGMRTVALSVGAGCLLSMSATGFAKPMTRSRNFWGRCTRSRTPIRGRRLADLFEDAT
jgi:hypothetical protein